MSTIVPINLTDDQMYVLYEIADTHFDGNVSEAVRAALASNYPKFASAKQPRPRRRRKPARQIKQNDNPEFGKVLVQLVE